MMRFVPRFLTRWLGRSAPTQTGRVITARYDAAQTNDDNRRHWAAADDLSANAANSPDVRRILRRRSRYECGNNGYLGGTTRTQAEDLIGTCPRPQLAIPDVDPKTAKRIEKAFRKWADAVLLPEKLLVLDEARRRDGEVFAVFGTSQAIPDPVKLSVILVETEMVADPSPKSAANMADGIELDPTGVPISYTILRNHPGDTFVTSYGPFDAIKVRAADVLHWFRPDRPRQARGVPETKAALPLGSVLRRYTMAVLGAAEWAASMVGVMKTNTPAAEQGPTVETMDRVEFERGALLTLPDGWDASQFDAKQPTGTYREFKGEILNEMGRGQGVPFNVISGNSSGYNYSSGRLDHLPYQRSVRIQRNLLRLRVLDPLFRAWAGEYLLVPEAEGGAPAGLPPLADWEWTWNWDGFDSIDPVKDAATDRDRLETNTTTLAEIFAAYGQDWEEQIEQRAREKKRLEELGLTETATRPTPSQDQEPAPQDEEAANV